MSNAWQRIEAEAHGVFLGAGRFPLRAYSELMPPPYVGLKPYAPRAELGATTDRISDGDSFDLDEYEQAQSIGPGLDQIADQLVTRLERLLRGGAHGLSRTLLDDNPAWPAELDEAARDGRLEHDPLVASDLCKLLILRRNIEERRIHVVRQRPLAPARRIPRRCMTVQLLRAPWPPRGDWPESYRLQNIR